MDFKWVSFYQEFANKLLEYKDRREELVQIIYKVYEKTGLNMPMFEYENEFKDIDPFTVMGTFNKGLSDANRIKLVSAYAELLNIDKEIPTSFVGIPVLNSMKANFYGGDRGENDFNNLWEVFANAIAYADTNNDENKNKLVEYYNKSIKQSCVKWNITMALYWIRPYKFINLDSRNRWFLMKSGSMPDEYIEAVQPLNQLPTGEQYLIICENTQRAISESDYDYKSFPELSAKAWIVSEEVNESKKPDKKPSVELPGNGLADNDVDTVRYWIYAPGDNACKWDEFFNAGIMAIGWGKIGDLSQYASKEDMRVAMKEKIDPTRSHKMAALATWQFSNEMKVGDVIFVKKGIHQLLGKGIVKSDYYFDDSSDDEFNHIRNVEWICNGSWPHPGQASQKTLTNITPYTDYVEKLNALFETEEDFDDGVIDKAYPAYSKEQFLQEVYISDENYETLVGLLKNKKNVILQGAPGVGKTFAAKRLAYSIIGEKNPERVMMVQFHQSYSYEDFIEGFRPALNGGFEMKKGSFYKFCKKAEEDIDNDYFFIIDEINRGNLSKIFGELFMLIESDKRGNALQLLYSDEKFCVPKNVYIIGMMNTADRSLAMLDYALRRRFAFYDMKPGFDSEGFKHYQKELNSPVFDNLINAVKSLNKTIVEDETLGEGFSIGHSYFCNLIEPSVEEIKGIVEYELVPLVKEYWFDDTKTMEEEIDKLRGSIR